MDNLTDMSTNSDRVDDRLDRIESKIDKLSDAVIAIARAEERIVAIEADKQDYWQRLNNHSKKIDEHDLALTKALGSIEMIEKMANRDRDEYFARQKDQGERLGMVEKSVADISRTTTIIHRLAWSAAAGFILVLVNQIGSFF
jgi:chromosome segregation ATPase